MVSMKALSLVLTSLISAQAFQPMLMKTSITNAKESSTTLPAVSRRCALLHGAAAAFLVAGSLPSFADITPLEPNNPIPDNEYVPAQRARSDKIDLNSAFVGDYKRLQGFFPHAAGMIASHGPYEKVSDIYKIEGLTANDKKLFKKYEDEFVVKPPNKRTFNERINARVST